MEGGREAQKNTGAVKWQTRREGHWEVGGEERGALYAGQWAYPRGWETK